MAGIREVIKTAQGIEELAFILSVPVETVERVAERFMGENKGNESEQIIQETLTEKWQL